MARPKKNGIEYFPLDVDIFDDEKIVAVSGEYGITGEIAALRLLCAIYRNGYYMEWSEIARYKLMRSMPGVTADQITDIVASLVKWGFFDRQIYESHGVLTSHGIQTRYFHSVKKRVLEDNLPYLLITLPEKTVSACDKEVSAEETAVSVEKTPQSIVYESKGNNSKENQNIIEGERETEGKDERPDTPLGKSEGSAGSRQPYGLSAAEEAARLGADTQWCASLARIHNMSPQTVNDYLTMFAAEQCGVRHTSLDDARSHFARWLRKLTAAGVNPAKAVSNAAEQRRRLDKRHNESTLEHQRIMAERVSAADYLRSKGYNPAASIADIIRTRLTSPEGAKAESPGSVRSECARGELSL